MRLEMFRNSKVKSTGLFLKPTSNFLDKRKNNFIDGAYEKELSKKENKNTAPYISLVDDRHNLSLFSVDWLCEF